MLTDAPMAHQPRDTPETPAMAQAAVALDSAERADRTAPPEDYSVLEAEQTTRTVLSGHSIETPVTITTTLLFHGPSKTHVWRVTVAADGTTATHQMRHRRHVGTFIERCLNILRRGDWGVT